MDIVKAGLFIIISQVQVGFPFRPRAEDPRAAQEAIYQVRVECDLTVSSDSPEKRADLQVMVDLLKIEVANIFKGGS